VSVEPGWPQDDLEETEGHANGNEHPAAEVQGVRVARQVGAGPSPEQRAMGTGDALTHGGTTLGQANDDDARTHGGTTLGHANDDDETDWDQDGPRGGGAADWDQNDPEDQAGSGGLGQRQDANGDDALIHGGTYADAQDNGQGWALAARLDK